MAVLDDLDKISDRDREDLAGHVEDLYLADRSARRPFEAVWAENLAFLAGDHYVQLDPRSWSVNRVPPLTGRLGYVPRPKTNYVLKIFRALVANILKTEPRVMVRPRGTDDKNKMAARMAEKAVDALDELLCWDEQEIELATWMYACGCGFRKDYIDTTEAAKLMVPRPAHLTMPDGQPLLDEEGEPEEVTPSPSTVEYVLGREILSPFQMGADPLAVRPDQARWWMEFSVHPLSWVREMFDRDEPGYTGLARDVEGESFRASPGLLFWTQLKGLVTTQLDRVSELTVVKEFYQAPSRKHPFGRCLVVASGKLLYSGPSPYMPKFWHPYTMFPCFPMPGRFWPLSVLEFLTNPQRRLNSIDAMQMFNRNTMAMPRWFVPKGSGIPRDGIVGVPGQVVEYNATGGSPVAADGRGLPPDVVQERQQTIADMEAVGGTQDILGGDRPKGVPSYSALAFLQENASDVHKVTLNFWKKGLERSNTKALQIVAMYYTADHPELTVLLRDKLTQVSTLELQSFTGSDLMDNCDVYIEAGTNIPRSRTLYQQTILEFLKMGFLQQAMADPEKMTQLFDLFGLADFTGHNGEDVRKMQLENSIFTTMKQEDIQVQRDPMTQQPMVDPTTGQPMVATPVTSLFLPEEDHTIHIPGHLRLLKDPKSIEKGPLYVAAVRAHLAQHQQVYMQQMMQQQAMQAGPQPVQGGGAPAESAGSSPPA